jgi:acetyl esterase/lipase
MNIIFFVLGGNMAVVVERRLRREQKPIIHGVLLLYPLLQLVNFRLSSYRTYLPYRLLSILREDTLVEVPNFYVNASFSEDVLFTNRHLSLNDYNNFYSKLNLKISNKEKDDINIDQSLSESSHPDTWKLFNENVSPLLADDDILRNSPATFIVACTYDILLSDAQLYFHRLQQLNVKNVLYREYRIFHGVMTFVDFPVAFNEAFDIINDSAQFVVNRTTLVK